MIKIRGMNWNTGNGLYEYGQTYTAFAKQSYTASKVVFKTFAPNSAGDKMGLGFRKKPEGDYFTQTNGVIISSGLEEVLDPENIGDREAQIVDFIGAALIVRDSYKPEYQLVEKHNGNHAFKTGAPDKQSFEVMLSSASTSIPTFST